MGDITLEHQMCIHAPYHAFTLQEPPNGANICGMTKEELVKILRKKRSPYRKLQEFHSWGYAHWGHNLRFKDVRISMLLRIIFNQDPKHQPRSWYELNDFTRDAGPRLLKPAVVTGEFLPISWHYPDPPERAAQVEPSFARPIDAPPSISDAYLERMALPAMREQQISEQASAYENERQQAEASHHLEALGPKERVSQTNNDLGSDHLEAQFISINPLQDNLGISIQGNEYSPDVYSAGHLHVRGPENPPAGSQSFPGPNIELPAKHTTIAPRKRRITAGIMNMTENAPIAEAESFAGPSAEHPGMRITMPQGKSGIAGEKMRMTESAPIAEDSDMEDDRADGRSSAGPSIEPPAKRITMAPRMSRAANDYDMRGENRGEIHRNARVPAVDREAHLPIAEEIERVLMRSAYSELERHPTAASLEAARPHFTATEESALRIAICGLFPITSQVKLAQDPKATYNLRLATDGYTYPYRGRGPEWCNFSSAVDCAIVAGRLLDAGSTNIDRKRQGWQDRFTDVEKAFIEATDVNWDVLISEESVSHRDRFLHFLLPDPSADAQQESIETLRDIWNTCTQNFDQFRLTYTETRSPCKCDASEVTKVSCESTSVRPCGPPSGHENMEMQDVLSRDFSRQRYRRCEWCGKNLVAYSRRYQKLPLRLAVELPPGIFVHSHTQDLTFTYRDEQERQYKVTYRWLGGIYCDDSQMRLFWTDAKRGEHDNTGSLRMYDSREISGLIVGGIAPADLTDRVPEKYWRGKQVPLLFYERIMNPDTEDFRVALSAVNNMLQYIEQGDLILQQNPGWAPSGRPRGQDVYPWGPILNPPGKNFSLLTRRRTNPAPSTRIRTPVQEQPTGMHAPFSIPNRVPALAGSAFPPMAQFLASNTMMDTTDVMMTSPSNLTNPIRGPQSPRPAPFLHADYTNTPQVPGPNSAPSASGTFPSYLSTPEFSPFGVGGLDHSPFYGQYPTAMDTQQVSPVHSAQRINRSNIMSAFNENAFNANAYDANACHFSTTSTPTRPWRY
ncbi:hypothetical protein BO94DRAFT_610007 [Aspergillus sclerotioniger CBS 115572]|uniref:Uncharacterized protein n=1 Tax=Aspergillus sclerotioniger CBS 115572 TaxID=1450535 RepID=A0A317XDH8_9EURO|nr:hypothetical protein BO94DRAFT_610007 [Aspergillus sclerotioniger CBS 115572]PWY94590.1 hypothetical protein BO94DRAFT_610007 [Aspergillus sclerotioniger CBS 115572]